jgi:hypothetical protein
MVTEDGRTLVGLNIGFKGIGRSLTDSIALVAAEQYEVAFYFDDTANTQANANVYRTTWADGQRGTLWVETDNAGAGVDYGAAPNGAILFAGYSNGTLLAVGELTAVDGTTSKTITDASRTVTFALTPLHNDIYAAATDPSDSTFKITGGAPLTSSLTAFETVTIDGWNYPVYELPTNGAAITATYAVENLPASGIVLAAAPKVIPKLIEVPEYYKAMDVRGSFTGLTYSGTSPGTSLPAPVTGVTTFNLGLITQSNEGLIKLCFEIPINAWSIDDGYNKNTLLTDVKPGRWFIRGGISNTILDMGVSRDSEGGAVLIGVGTYEMPSKSGWINVDTQ